MNNFKKYVLPIVVFLTGACVLVIEVVATRILSPYYGSTIYTVSSVIGVVLAALSVGYYFGGKLADKYPTEKFFYSIILFSGFAVVILHLLTLSFLPYMGYRFSMISGPLLFSLILFFIPSLILGTLSPFTIKLQEKYFPEKGIGSISGEIFFWSTLGSIFGSLFTGFFLIPHFGINQIVLGVAILLILLGLLPLIKIGLSKKTLTKVLVLSFLLVSSVVLLANVNNRNIIYSYDGLYAKYSIFDREYRGKQVRFLIQDRASSSATFLDSDDLVFDYSKYYFLHKFLKSDIKNTLVIGGGAYSIPKIMLRDLPNAEVDVSEVEASLYEIAQKYFALTKSDRLHNFTDDGRRCLYDTNKEYDFIFSDVYNGLSVPAHFTTREFFELAKNKMSSEGIFMANLIGDLDGKESPFILSEIKTFQAVFPNSYFFASESPENTGTQNIIFLGYNSDQKIDWQNLELNKEDQEFILPLLAKEIDLNKFDFSKAMIFTDNHAPVEYLTAKVLKNIF